MAKKDRNRRKEFVVFGVGKFGLSVAKTLADNGCQVMAVDSEQSKVEEIANEVTYAVCTDVTDADAIHSLGIRNFDGAIVAIGENLEASVLVTIISKEMGIPFVLAKAQTELQAKVLKKVGADKIIFPEKESGTRLAKNLLSSGFVDIIELTNDVSMIEMDVKAEWVGKNLLELNLRKKYGINVVAILQGKNVTINIDPEKPLTASMELVVIVQTSKLGKLKQV